jgi:hypothetical protein
MATVIDSLLVTLGLDAKGYLASAAAARAERKKLSAEEAAAARDAETYAKRRTEAYTTFRGEIRRVAAEAASLFAVFTAGKGLSQFIADITTGDAATGRLAKNLGMATGDLAAWERAVERAGGSAAGFDATISSLSREVQNYQLTGQSGGMLNYFRALGVQLTGTSEDLLKISGVVSGMNRQQATALMTGAGIDQGTQNLLLEGTAKVRAALEEAKKLGVPSDKDAKNAQDLLANIMKVRQAVEDTVRVILNQFGPSINQALAEFTVWITVNGPRLKTEIADRITWIVSEVRSFITSANDAATAVGGWVHISEALFALWAVSKVAGLIKAVATVGGVFGGAGAVGSLARLAGPVGVAAAVMAPSSANAGEDERLKREHDERAKDPAAYDRKLRAGQNAMNEAGASKREQDSFIDRLAKTLVQFMWHPAEHLDTGTGTQGVTPSEGHGRGFGAGPQLGTSAPALPGREQMARAQQAHAYFVKQGWTPEQASGIVANLHKESGFNTGAVGDTNEAYGIAQWHGDRRAAIHKMTGRSLVGASFEQQLEAVHLELTKGQEQAAGNALRQTRTAREAGAAVSKLYERPKARDQEAIERGGLAERFNAQFGLGGGRPAITTPPTPTPQQVSQLRYGNSSTNSTSNDNSSQTHIGSVTIQTAATDARGIVGSFKQAMSGMGLAAQANTGLS